MRTQLSLATIIFLVGCSDTSTETLDAGIQPDLGVVTDSGIDAAPVDLGIDAVVDTGVDEGTTDLGTDAGPCGGACGAHATCVAGADAGDSCVCDAGYEGDGHTCTDVAVTLDGLLWELPCTGPSDGTACDAGSDSDSVTLGGDSSVSYEVTLRIRGIVEQRTYTGGTMDGFWYSGTSGVVCGGDTYNLYSLHVSAPEQTYYVNAGTSAITNCWVMDYERTVVMQGGATIDLGAESCDARQIINKDPSGAALSVEGVSVEQPYNGQFVQIDVVNVRVAP